MTAPKKTTIKVPQDKKPKATAEAEAKGVEEFVVNVLDEDWTIEASAMDDFELLADFAAMDRGGFGAAMATASALPRMLGKAQAAKALAKLRDPETGRVSVEAGSQFFRDIFEGINPNS